MEPYEYFHDHPVIDEREDGIYIYFHDMPPLLLKDPIIYCDEDLPSEDCPDEDNDLNGKDGS